MKIEPPPGNAAAFAEYAALAGRPKRKSSKQKMGFSDESASRGVGALEFLWSSSKQIADHCAQIEFQDVRRVIAIHCFRRIMLMTLTFLRLNPLSSFFPENGPCDLPSSAVIARCILETYLRLFYFGVEEVDKAEGHFRAQLSQYHAWVQQLKIHTHSGMPDKLLAPMRATRDQTRAALEKTDRFRSLPSKRQKELLKDPNILNLGDTSQKAGISPGYHHSNYALCSNFVHGSLTPWY
jgi:Family of unknown function (DUF5677)